MLGRSTTVQIGLGHLRIGSSSPLSAGDFQALWTCGGSLRDVPGSDERVHLSTATARGKRAIASAAVRGGDHNRGDLCNPAKIES